MRARELNPRYLQNLDWYALLYLAYTLGRFDDAIAIATRAAEYDPLSGYAQAILAMAYVQPGRGAPAVQAAKYARELEESFFTCWALQQAFHTNRQFDDALAAGEMALALSGRHVFAMSTQARIFADWGKTSAAQALYAELAARARQGYLPAIHMAITASAAGEYDKAVAHAREAYEAHDPMLVFRYYSDFARLREDPRFDEILTRISLK